MIGGNERSALGSLKKKLQGVPREEYYTLQLSNELNPFCKPLVRNTRHRYKIFKTMRRNAMRGIKLNKKRGGIGTAAISQFGQVKRTTTGPEGEAKPTVKPSKGWSHFLFLLRFFVLTLLLCANFLCDIIEKQTKNRNRGRRGRWKERRQKGWQEGWW